MNKPIKKKVAIVGASAAGLYAAIFLKRNHPEDYVILIDQNDKIGKKVLATGNGHCNLLNRGFRPNAFNCPSFMESALKRHPVSTLFDSLDSLGVKTMDVGDLVYPLSYSAASYVRYLGNVLAKHGVHLMLSTKVFTYKVKEQVALETDKGPQFFDEVIFAVGGKSQPNLGSDGSLFSEFAKHGYQVNPLRPSLCPIRTLEPTKQLSGVRHKATVTLSINGQTAYQERGEVLFKDDGLSGIAIFDCAHYLCCLNKGEKASISLDLFPDIPTEALAEDLLEASKENPEFFLEAYLEKPLKDYCLKRAGFDKKTPQNRCEMSKFAQVLKELEFTFKELYPFASSQVSAGGIDLAEVDESLRSKREKGIYFVGECLDVDGLCGGFNLGWCLLSALLVSEDH